MNENTLNYINMIHVIKSWFDDNIINAKEFIKLESFLANKYCIKNNNIYRVKDLINPTFRAIYKCDKKEE